jgi:UDP-glucose 4-epimerase
MRCLVTGASGHLGSHLTRLLLDSGEDVTVLVRPSSNLWRLDGILDRVHVIYGNLEDPGNSAAELRRASPETVFHLAWSGVTARSRNRPEMLIGNVTGSLQLFRIVQTAGCRCWVGIGSQAEYGRRTEPLSEEMDPRPDTLYGEAKLCLSRMLASLCGESGIRFVWMRLLAAYGPKDSPEHLIPYVIEKLLDGSRPALTTGEQLWDYLYVEDAAEAIYTAGRSGPAEGVYNLASGRPEIVRNIVMTLRNMIDPRLPLGFGEIPTDPSRVTSLSARITKLEGATGWFPKTDLERGLRQTLEWHKIRKVS